MFCSLSNKQKKTKLNFNIGFDLMPISDFLNFLIFESRSIEICGIVMFFSWNNII